MCQHQPQCPPADAVDHEAACLVAFHPEQGWGLLCNGVVVFDDTGELLPDGRSVPPLHQVPYGREAYERAA
ncbi:DUF5999 family protein [Sphaerisporangium sp. NPDC051017]|uniref:DUF5999 family protein n=1 Tax=unclassified Sphaerisporangium TaxID=2630420 RepID=UPI00340D0E39